MSKRHDIVHHTMHTEDRHLNLLNLVDVCKHVEPHSRHVIEHHSDTRRQSGDKHDPANISTQSHRQVNGRPGAE